MNRYDGGITLQERNGIPNIRMQQNQYADKMNLPEHLTQHTN